VVVHGLWPILDALKIPRCGLYPFRHKRSSMLVESGAPISVAPAQLGDADPSVTLGIYCRDRRLAAPVELWYQRSRSRYLTGQFYELRSWLESIRGKELCNL
jgi:integrase